MNRQKLFFLLFLQIGIVKLTFSQAKDSLNIVPSLMSVGFSPSQSIRNPDVVVIHSSYCPTLADSFNLACILDLYNNYKVSAHYIIDRNGKIFQLVDEQNVAYHGGKGVLPDGETKINSRSIGIELINTKVSFYTEAQYISLSELIKSIQKRWKINYILGHKDVAPKRKTDPWNFDWNCLWEKLN